MLVSYLSFQMTHSRSCSVRNLACTYIKPQPREIEKKWYSRLALFFWVWSGLKVCSRISLLSEEFYSYRSFHLLRQSSRRTRLELGIQAKEPLELDRMSDSVLLMPSVVFPSSYLLYPSSSHLDKFQKMHFEPHSCAMSVKSRWLCSPRGGLSNGANLMAIQWVSTDLNQ